jgi:cell division septation protein DedD
MRNVSQPSDKPHDSERRRHPRQNVVFSSAELANGNDGIILNISESGVALHAFSEITTDDLPDLRLQLSLEQPWIEVKGKVVWRSQSRKTVGVQFVDLASSARERIKIWISEIGEASTAENSASSDVDVADAATGEDPLPPAVNAVAKTVGATISETVVSEPVISEQARHKVRLEISDSNDDPVHKRTVFITVVACMLLLAVAYLGWSKSGGHGSTEDSRSGSNIEPAPAAASPNSSDNLPNPASNGAPTSRGLPRGEEGNSPSGFVLQVAAVKNENNAIALASQLTQKQFPAFVVNSPGSDLYRVLVGPYGDGDTAANAEADLRREGFSSIRQKNTPTP